MITVTITTQDDPATVVIVDRHIKTMIREVEEVPANSTAVFHVRDIRTITVEEKVETPLPWLKPIAEPRSRRNRASKKAVVA